MRTIANPQTTEKLCVLDILGDAFMPGPLDGEKVYTHVSKAFSQRAVNVILDFSNMQRIMGPFLVSTIGKLYETYPPEEIERRLSFEGLSEQDIELMKRVKKNAVWYYTDKEGYIQCYEEALDECGF